MAIDLIDGNTSRYFSTPDHADWTFPTGSDWFFYIWTRVDDNTGTLFQYIFSTGSAFTANSTNLYLVEDSAAADPGAWVFIGASNADADVLNSNADGGTSPGGDGKDRLIGIQRVGGNIEMWFVEKGQTAVKQATETEAQSRNGGAVNIGRRTDGNTARYYEEHLGDTVKGSTSLTEAQWTLLGQGISPVDVAGAGNVDIWIPFRETAATTEDLISGKVVTRQGTGHLTSEHFPLVTNANIFIPAMVAVSGRIMSSLVNSGGLAGLGGLAGTGGGLAG
jgi:hypothetical protein